MKDSKGLNIKLLILLGLGFIFNYGFWFCKNAYKDGNLGIHRFLHGDIDLFNYGVPVKYTAMWFLLCLSVILCFTVLDKRFNWSDRLKFICAIVVMGYYVFGTIRVLGYYNDERDIQNVRNYISDTRYITHAGGYIVTESGRTVSYTNSLESLINSYESGSRLMEFDIRYSSDGVLICAHPGQGDYKGKWTFGTDKEDKPTAKEFKEWKLYGSLTTMTFDDLASFVREHEDLWLIIDVKNKGKNTAVCKYINENYPEIKDRIIVEIYTDKEYKKIKKLGYEYMIFCLYKYSIDDFDYSVVDKAVRKQDLIGIAYPTEWADMEDFYGHMSSLNVPMYVHTVNDKQSMKRYLDMGFEGMFTDVVDSSELY